MSPLKSTLLFGLAAFSAVASAAPTFNLNLGKRTNQANLDNLIITLTNGSSALPLPADGQVLKAVTVGVGFQNYTCAGGLSAPKSVGAVATLVDAADGLLPFIPEPEALPVLDLLPGFLFPVGRTVVDASALPKSGIHFFNAAGTPVFDLTESGVGFFQGPKSADILAPPGSVTGPNGAVDWLALTAASGSDGIATVYRIFTASGSPPPSCDGQPADISVPYSAQYWFFG